jgi:hypothetical protein
LYAYAGLMDRIDKQDPLVAWLWDDEAFRKFTEHMELLQGRPFCWCQDLDCVWVRDNHERPVRPVDECHRGHPFTPENSVVRDGRRRCRVCERLSYRRSRVLGGRKSTV